METYETDDENYAYLPEGDLDKILDEGDVQEALASYREMRQSLKERRLVWKLPGERKRQVRSFRESPWKVKNAHQALETSNQVPWLPSAWAFGKGVSKSTL